MRFEYDKIGSAKGSWPYQNFLLLPGLAGESIPQNQDETHQPVKSSGEVTDLGRKVSPLLLSGILAFPHEITIFPQGGLPAER